MKIKQKVNNKNINRPSRNYTVNSLTYRKRFLFLGSVFNNFIFSDYFSSLSGYAKRAGKI